MITIIDQWYGRFGNNLIQLIHAIHFMKTYGYKTLCFPPHPHLNTSTALNLEGINKGDGDDSGLKLPCIDLEGEGETIEDGKYMLDTFYDTTQLKEKYNLDPLSPSNMKAIFIEHLVKYVHPDIIFKPFEGQEVEDTLMIHIRGGDLFKNNGVHVDYVQPPLDYYKKIIESQDWYAVNIVYEDSLNPCVDALKEYYSERQNILFQSSDLATDLNTLLAARNVCIGYGTFGFLIYLMSPNITNIFLPHYVLEDGTSHKGLPKGDWGIHVHTAQLDNYIPVGTWNNTPDQKKMMMEYTLPKLDK